MKCLLLTILGLHISEEVEDDKWSKESDEAHTLERTIVRIGWRSLAGKDNCERWEFISHSKQRQRTNLNTGKKGLNTCAFLWSLLWTLCKCSRIHCFFGWSLLMILLILLWVPGIIIFLCSFSSLVNCEWRNNDDDDDDDNNDPKMIIIKHPTFFLPMMMIVVRF